MRLMVYSHDTFGLGNIRRSLVCAEQTHRRGEDGSGPDEIFRPVVR
jgi:predicted glycosyltransferase